MRVTLDLSKKSTQIIDLSDVINPRVGDDDLLLPLHIVYGDNQTDMRGKDVEFLTQDTNNNNIYIAGTCNTNTPGDNLYMGDLTFRFPAGTFKVDGTYDPDKTMFRIVDKATQKVISSANVKITVMKNAIEFNFDPDKSSYDSRLEEMLSGFHDKGQAMLDEINDLNNQAKSNVSGDTAATAKQAKEQANKNASDISGLKGEVAGARGRFADMAGREDAQDTAINQKESIANASANYAALKQKDAQQDTAISQKESIANANANYAALQQKDAQQDTVIANKANHDFITNYLSRMNLEPESFENEASLKAKYPNGEPGLMITADTGHKWLYVNGQWKDCGIYQTAGLAENAVKNMELVTPDQANDFDANTIAGNTVYRFLNAKGATDVTLNTPFGSVWGTDAVCLLLTIGQSAVPGTVQYFINTGDDTVYHRTYVSGATGSAWTSWKLASADKLVSKSEMITPSNSQNFDFDSAENNSVIRVLLDSSAAIPAHAPFKTYPGGIGVLETWGAGLGAVQKYTQVYKDMAQDTSVWYRYKAKDWYSWYQANAKAISGNGKLKITVGSGKDFTKLKDAIESAMSSAPANAEIVVYPGTYDLIQEFGEDYFNNISGGELNGLMIGNGLTITFLSGSHVTANYEGANSNVMKGFSPFNITQGDVYIKGLDLECSRVRYGIHDERADNPSPYTTKLRDCRIYMDNTQNTAWSPRQCIGGGLGEHGTISIGRCSFESNDISGGVVTYHNGSTADCESTITIYDSYFGGSNNANVGFGYRGASTHATTINLFGNSWTSAPNVHPETPSETNVNMELGRVFNNELRTV